MGSDDRLFESNTLNVAEANLSSIAANIAYGDVIVKGSNSFLKDGERYAGRFDFAMLTQRNICQQAVFYRRSLFGSSSGFNPKFRACADWAFILGYYAKETPEWIDLIVAEYNAGGLSSKIVDNDFADEKPNIVLRSMLMRPLEFEMHSARWILRDFAAEAASRGHHLQSVSLLLGWSVLAFVSRFTNSGARRNYI